MGGSPINPLDLMRPDMELLRGTIAGIVSDKVKEATDALHEPTEAMKTIAIQVQDLNNNMRQLNSVLNILAERLK